MTHKLKMAVYTSAANKIRFAQHAEREGISLSEVVYTYALNWLNMLEQNNVSIKLSPRSDKPFSLAMPEDKEQP